MFEGAWNIPLEGVLCHFIFLIYLNHVYGQVKRYLEIRNNAVFLSGNGLLVTGPPTCLKNSIFVQDVHGFLKVYGGARSKIPHEHNPGSMMRHNGPGMRNG